MTLLRSLIVGVLAVAAALPLRTLLADRRRPLRRAAWILLLAPYLTPVLLTGYAYAGSSLSLIHHPALNTLFYSALLWWKFTPLAAVILYFTPAPISAEAIHCRRLISAASRKSGDFIAEGPGSKRCFCASSAFRAHPFSLSRPARNERGESRREGRLIMNSTSPRPSPPASLAGREKTADHSTLSSPSPSVPATVELDESFGKSGGSRHNPAAGAARCGTALDSRQVASAAAARFSHWIFLVRAGCAGGPVAALAVVFLFTFAEFEMASLMMVKSWTVAQFDAHAGGLALGESLRRMTGPLLCEAAAITAAFVVLARRQVTPASDREGSRAGRWFAWGHLGLAFVFVLLLPATTVLRGALRGLGPLLENFVLGREILASLLFAAGASALAGLLALGMGAAARSHQPGSVLCRLILVAGIFAGLLGPLALALAVLAAIQLPGLIAFRDTPLPLVFTLGVVLLPVALVLSTVLALTRPRSALHLAGLLKPSPAARELTWRLSTSGRFWAMVLLFVWAYWDLTASAILAPIGMTPVTVRLYNLMHYGQIAALSAMTCAALAAPILILLLARGTRRWWAPQ